MHALEAAELWPSGSAYEDALSTAVHRGIMLRDGLLSEALGPDAPLLAGEVLFGPANRGMRRRMPQVLAFGAGLTEQMSLLAGASVDRARTAGDAGALFNVGISLFDLVYDSMPELATDVSSLLNTSTVRRLATDPHILDSFAVPEDASAEVRVLMSVIGAFYRHWHRLAPTASPAHRLFAVATLERAHRDEMQSVMVGAEADYDVAKATSIVPFEVLAALAGTAANGSAPTSTDWLGSFGTVLGEVFWLVDDLVDTVEDFQGGWANALLTESGRGDKGLLRLLEADIPDKHAAMLAERLSTVVTMLADPSLPPEPAQSLTRCVTSAVRSWME